jgi:hypothetical protein
MTAFEKAWAVVKMPRTMEEVMHYEAGRCPSCEGTGQMMIMTNELDPSIEVDAEDIDDHRMKARNHPEAINNMRMMECVACDGTGKPDDEVWGDEGVMEEEEGGLYD